MLRRMVLLFAFASADMPCQYRKKREQASVREAVKEQKEHSQLPEFGDRRGTQKEGLEEV